MNIGKLFVTEQTIEQPARHKKNNKKIHIYTNINAYRHTYLHIKVEATNPNLNKTLASTFNQLQTRSVLKNSA